MALPEVCRYCGADRTTQNVVSAHVYGGRPEQAFFRCEACGIVYLYPTMTEQETTQFFTEGFENYMAGRAGDKGGWDDPQRHVAANAWQVDRRLRYLEPRLPATGRVLEFGCSSGFMLYPLAERGLDCVGVEPSSAFRDYVGSRGLACHPSVEALVAAGDLGSGFDLIVHFFVLDYLLDPLAFLRAQLELLRPGGRIVFEVPSAEDPLHTIYNLPAFERFLWSVDHPCYFTGPSLTHQLERLGRPYEILRDQRYDLSNHMIWARDGRPGGMGRFTPVIGPEIEDQYRAALIKAGLTDTLIGVVENG